MPKTKISEFSATAGNNTDIDGINIAEGCPPSGINDAIRELMSQLKDFQAGTAGDSFNGPVGTTTPAAGAFTNFSASGTFALTGDQVQISEGGTGQTTANAAFNALAPSQSTHAGKYLKTDGTNTSWDAIEINTADITGTLPVANGGTGVTSSTGTGSVVLSASPTFTGTVNGAALTLSSSLTLSGGTANGVAYLNGSKVLTTGSALTFDGTNFVNTAGYLGTTQSGATSSYYIAKNSAASSGVVFGAHSSGAGYIDVINNNPLFFAVNDTEQMRLTSTGLGIGTSSPDTRLTVSVADNSFAARFKSTNGIFRVLPFETGLGVKVTALNGSESAFEVLAYQAADHRFVTGVTERMRITSAGDVGIGTSSPAYKLDVNGSMRSVVSTGGTLLLGDSNNTTAIRSVPASGDSGIGFYTQALSGNSLRMTIDYLGNLGLGVTPAAWYTADGVTRAIQVSTTGALIGNANAMRVSQNLYFDASGAPKYLTTGTAVQYLQNSGQHSWLTAASGTAGNAISFTQAMTLDASGNLFVGATSSAAGKFIVKDNSSGNNIWLIGRSSDGTSSISFRNNADTAYNARIECFDTGVLTFGTGTSATERARITSGGDLLVGTTTANGAKFAVNAVPNNVIGSQAAFIAGAKTAYAGIAQLPQGQLFVYDTNSAAGSGGAISFGGDASGGQQTWYAAIEARKDNSTAGDYGAAMVFYTRPSGATAGERARIDSSGRFLVGQSTYSTTTDGVALQASGSVFARSGTGNSTNINLCNGNGVVGTISTSGTSTAYNTSSDYRLKENQQPLTGSGAFIDALQPKTWDWKTDGSKGVGFIAHEVQEVSPGSVVGTKDAVDEEGNPIMQGMEYGSAEFIANIIAELQSLRARVAQLEAK